jgi:multicomponent K+:H+ antiporter subunit A
VHALPAAPVTCQPFATLPAPVQLQEVTLLALLLGPFAGALALAVRAGTRPAVPAHAAHAAHAGIGGHGAPAVVPDADTVRLRRASMLAGAATAVSMAALAALAPAVFAGQVARAGWDWLPALGAGFGLRLDGLALLFALLIVGIGLLVILYGRYYLSPAERTERFYALLLAFMGSMLGIAVSDNLIQLVVFWELTSLSSFLLIGFWQHRADARQGARMALAVTGAGGLCLLGGVLLLGAIAGSYRLDDVLQSGAQVRAHPWYPACLALVLLGAFTKSAQFPFHFWLPHAMAAPTPVSAYLHSATMVKAGLFLLARLYPVLSGTELWFFAVSGVGIATLITGAWHAVFQHDLKGLLAYSTISHLGLMMLLLGLNSPLAAVAAVFHLLNHAVFKASLFMAAGIIDHETGTRDMRRINGLWRYMPYTATLAMVAASAMAGVPLLNGFLSKEMFFAETLALEGHRAIRWATPVAATLAGSFAVAYSMRFVHDVFFNGEPESLPREPHEPPRWMRVPVELLVLACLLVGFVPAWTIGPLLALGARDVLGGTLPQYSLALWHGLTAPLLMSVLAMAGGVALYFWLQRARRLHRITIGSGLGKRSFDRGLATLLAAATALSRRLDAGGQQHMLLTLVATAIAATALPWLLDLPVAGDARHGASVAASQAAPGTPGAQGAYAALPSFGAGDLTAVALAWLASVPLLTLVVWAIGVAAALATVAWARQRLVALVLIGAVGLAVTLGFVWLSAPDLALTQLLVEVATVMLMVLALRELPLTAPPEADDLRKLRDAGIAAVAGIGCGALAWAIMTRPFDSISGYFLANTVAQGGGANAVNVIIVDFRGFDTFGEMTVLLAAALIVHALLSGGPAATWHRTPTAPVRQAGSGLLLQTVSRGLVPFALLLSAYFFLRGHNLPGGGFIAGLVTSIALLLARMSDPRPAGPAEAGAEHRLVRLLGAGLGLAVLTGTASWLLGYPFLTSTYGHPVLAVLGEIPLASASAFDLGVYLSVVGATLLVLSGLAPRAER